MNDAELDGLYTALCNALGKAGEARALGILSRFALLAMLEIQDSRRIEEMIERAAKQ